MTKCHRARLMLDIVLTGMLVFEMLYSLTGNMLHELVGALFFVTLICHMILSRKWVGAMRVKSAAGRGLTMKQRVKVLLCIALVASCVVLLVSSILISVALSDIIGWQLGASAYSMWSFAHTLAAYTFCAVTTFHVGIHWIGVFKVLRIPYSAERRRAINVGVMAAATVGVAALGTAASKALGALPIDMAIIQTDNIDESASEPASANDSAAPNAQRDASNNARGRGGNTPYRGQSESPSEDADASGNSANSNERSSGAPSGSGSSGAAGSSNPGAPSPSPDSGSSSGSSGSSGSSSSVCTLCGKRCPLSAPRCSKPYAAGLI